MSEGQEPRDVLAGPELRQRAVDALSEAFARDAFTVEEFERRVELAHRAETAAELRVLLSDIPRPAAPAVRDDVYGTAHEVLPVPRRSDLPVVNRPDQGFVVGVLGGGSRKGQWVPARYNYAIGVLGGAELDFRDCEFAANEVIDLRCFAFWGGIEIIVPPDIRVDSSGVGIMGGFEYAQEDSRLSRDAPVIRLTGVALMGGVNVTVRYPGETPGDAKKRRKLEKKARRERRRLERGG